MINALVWKPAHTVKTVTTLYRIYVLIDIIIHFGKIYIIEFKIEHNNLNNILRNSRTQE